MSRICYPVNGQKTTSQWRSRGETGLLGCLRLDTLLGTLPNWCFGLGTQQRGAGSEKDPSAAGRSLVALGELGVAWKTKRGRKTLARRGGVW
jgi:hypothetical protein